MATCKTTITITNTDATPLPIPRVLVTIFGAKTDMRTWIAQDYTDENGEMVAIMDQGRDVIIYLNPPDYYSFGTQPKAYTVPVLAIDSLLYEGQYFAVIGTGSSYDKNREMQAWNWSNTGEKHNPNPGLEGDAL